MKDVNQCNFLGNLTRDAETRTVRGNGKEYTITTFSMATNRSHKTPSGDWENKATFINVERWGLHEKVIEKLSKGCRVFVTGRLEVDKVEKDGVTKQYTKIVADDIMVQGSAKSDNRTGEYGDDSPF